MDDHALVERLRAGDEAAFAEVVDRYDRQLRRLARTFVRTDALADDVVGETWLAVIKGLDRFEERSSLKTWIFRILVNRARTRAVREARQIPFSSLAGDDDERGPDGRPVRVRRPTAPGTRRPRTSTPSPRRGCSPASCAGAWPTVVDTAARSSSAR